MVDVKETFERATAYSTLPSREHGPVVMPEPPEEAQRTAIRMLERHGELLRQARRARS